MSIVRDSAASAAVRLLAFASPTRLTRAVCVLALSALSCGGVAAAQQAQPSAPQAQQTAPQKKKHHKRTKKVASRVAYGTPRLVQVADLRQTTPDQPPATNAQPTTVEEVTVTGSRIKRTTDFNTPTPTTVIDSATMQAMGVVNVGQAALLAPANVATFSPANTGNTNFFTGEYIADLRGLNPYFGSRTLLLIDGQRIVNSDQGDSFDMNLLPTILVTRIDQVTGGASAAYGSGAIAGVENVILDDKLEGGKIDGDFYQTSHSDGRDRHLGAAWGNGFFDDRIHFVIGGEYENSDAVGCEDVRSWCAQNQGSYELGTTPAASGSADIIGYGTNIRSNYNSTTGVILPASVALFGPPSALNVNALGNGVTPYLEGGGLAGTPFSFADDVPGGQGTPIYQYTNLQAPVNRGTGMAILTGQINDYLDFKSSFLIAREATTNYNGTVSTLYGDISPQNAFACPNTPNGPAFGATCANVGAPGLADAIGTGAAMNKDWSDQVPAFTRFTTNVQRFTFGLDGKFGESSWTWDANYEYGLTHHQQLLQDNYSLYRIDMALDSVIGPDGQPECRVTADGFAGAVAANPLGGYAGANPLLAAGCVPINPFGNQPLTASQINYSFGNLIEDLRYEQTDATLNASGNIFSGVGAGPFSAAAGFEYRQERGDNVDQPGEPAYLADDYETQFGSSFGGLMSVYEEYLEGNFPLLKNEPGAHLLEFDIAGRESTYQNTSLYGIAVCTDAATCPSYGVLDNSTLTHNFPTWKFSGIYEPVDWLRFRASQSRDERAPNFRELYYNQVIGAGGIFGQCGPAGTLVDPCTWNLLGNPNLKPETSNTTTVGFVLTPREVAPGFQFSADYFHIKITNAIEQANPTLTELGCRAGDMTYCDQIEFNDTPVTATGAPCTLTGTPAEIYQGGCYNLKQINPTSYNGAYYLVEGIDFSTNYLLDLGKYGSLNTRLLTTFMDQQTFQSACLPGVYCPTYSILGQTGSGNGFLNDYTPTARWRGSLMITWSQGPLSITPNMTFVSHGVMDFLGVTPAEGKLYTETLDGTLPYPYNSYGLHPMPYNYVPSYFLFGLNGTYSFEDVGPFKGLQLFVQINNLFNKTPPFTGGESEFGPSNSYGGTNPIFFDAMGLAYRVGFRLNF
ncbi:MAG TPA: TonB-dependent receptor [Steroidobacteraceae bacterium]|nr:TonB-dependent receptor [Steroidobacteraceae bacterium]